MKQDEGVLVDRAIPGPRLYFRSAIPDTPTIAVGILHGYADHSGRYEHVMRSWADAGILSVALDMRGHGRAEGTRGFCARFDEYLDDVAELDRLLADRAKGLPRFLFGHSFGGLVASLSVMVTPRDWRGLVLSAPFFGVAVDVPVSKRALGRVASRLVPKLGLASGLRGSDMTHDLERARAYDTDPLVFKEVRARWFREAEKAQERVLRGAPGLKAPLYVVLGDEDRIAKGSTTREWFDAVGSADKEMHKEPGLLHEVLNEPAWKELAGTMARWMLARRSP